MRAFMLVPHEAARGPVPRITADLVSALRASGCDVVTHAWGQRRENESVIAKVRDRIRDVVAVWRELGDRNFDVGVVNTAHDWRSIARDAAVVPALRRRCGRVVLQLHGSDSSRLVAPGSRPFKVATRALLAFVHGLLVLSREEQTQWQKFHAGVPVFTVKNPYVREAEAPSSDVATAVSTKPRVLFVGRLIRAKGVFDLVDAFAQVVEEVPCELVIVGAGEQQEQLSERIGRLGIADSVSITGYLPGSDVRLEYEKATLFVFPTGWSEGFPTVLAEAMDAGLPIVTTQIRGAADHLVAGEHALFVEPRDVNGIALAILRLLGDHELRERMGLANLQQVRIFHPQTVAREYLQVLRSIVPNAGSASRPAEI
jgi:glycosyltransferase involved in cell wall biosynthesis